MLLGIMLLIGCCSYNPEIARLRLPARCLAAFLLLCCTHGTIPRSSTLKEGQSRTKHFVGFTLQMIAGNFERANSTYVILLPQIGKHYRKGQKPEIIAPKKFYIGSLAVTVHSRQDARIRKYRLLQEGHFTNTELMVHYF